jgi:hypothetical protein
MIAGRKCLIMVSRRIVCGIELYTLPREISGLGVVNSNHEGREDHEDVDFFVAFVAFVVERIRDSGFGARDSAATVEAKLHLDRAAA